MDNKNGMCGKLVRQMTKVHCDSTRLGLLNLVNIDSILSDNADVEGEKCFCSITIFGSM